MTGTPIQNNLLELWSLVTWLRFGVYAGRANLQLFRNQIELPCKRGQSEGFERLQVLVVYCILYCTVLYCTLYCTASYCTVLAGAGGRRLPAQDEG